MAERRAEEVWRLFHRTRVERLLWLIAGAFTALLVVEILVLRSAEPGLVRPVLGMIGTGLVLGREAAIPVGLAAGVPNWLVFQVSFTTDLAFGFLLFGTFVHWLRRSSSGDGRLGRWLARIEATAEERQGFVNRWGPWGVYLFMLVPFLVNGPLVAAVMGRLGGIATHRLIAPMIAATITAAAIWVAFADAFLTLTAQLQPGLEVALTAAFVGGMVALMIAKALWSRWRTARRLEQEDEGSDAEEAPVSGQSE